MAKKKEGRKACRQLSREKRDGKRAAGGMAAYILRRNDLRVAI